MLLIGFYEKFRKSIFGSQFSEVNFRKQIFLLNPSLLTEVGPKMYFRKLTSENGLPKMDFLKWTSENELSKFSIESY